MRLVSEGSARLQDKFSIPKRAWDMIKMSRNSPSMGKPAISSAWAVAERRWQEDNHSSGPLILQRLTIALQNHIGKGTVKIIVYVPNTCKHLHKTLTFRYQNLSKIEFARYSSSIKEQEAFQKDWRINSMNKHFRKDIRIEKID